MPELSDDMYCSQQIIVPPMFPYILRQYAKAAIRSQPTDLLRWSTAYFRCLSLNLPPPVKPRLEYPLPADYDGVTPGWLKALLFQLINNTHVDFKLLWDRWIGACQNHITLIKILCLSGFTDPMAIPLYRFIATCIGFLNENLTQTMIMFCEVVTEEPEGGSAMIPVEVFIDVYTFLAGIDASKEQVLLNRYFTDDLLDLLEKKAEKIAEAKEKKIAKRERSKISETQVSVEEVKIAEDRKDAISCPDLVEDAAVGSETSTTDDDQMEIECSRDTILSDKERKAYAAGKTVEELEAEQIAIAHQKQRAAELEEGEEEEEDDEVTGGSGLILGIASFVVEVVATHPVDDSESEKDALYESVSPGGGVEVDHEDEEDAEPTGEEEESEVHLQPETAKAPARGSIISVEGSKDRESGQSTKEAAPAEDEAALKADIDMYLKDQEVVLGERELSEMESKAGLSEEYSFIEGEAEGEEEPMAPKEKFTVEEVYVEVIPGIGGIVPTELVEAVIKYMKECASEQHGMVMPRNIRHYSCPPLEP